MGKVITMITILIFIDLLFLVTGQLCTAPDSCSFTSLIFEAIIKLKDGFNINIFTELIGDITNFASSSVGLWAILAGAIGVTLGTLITRSDIFLFIPVATSLALISSDFVVIFAELSKHSIILATLVIAPLLITYFIIILDWVRGKD